MYMYNIGIIDIIRSGLIPKYREYWRLNIHKYYVLHEITCISKKYFRGIIGGDSTTKSAQIGSPTSQTTRTTLTLQYMLN